MKWNDTAVICRRGGRGNSLFRRLRLQLVMNSSFTLVVLFFVSLVANGWWTQTSYGQEQLAGDVEQQPAEKIDKELQRRVRLLQRKLNTDDSKQREEAKNELIELGPKVLDYLADEDPGYSADFNMRLRSVRSQLELAVATSIIRPMMINLQGEMPLSEIAQALTAQTENNVQWMGDPEKVVSLDWEDMSLFAALDDLARNGLIEYRQNQAGIQLYETEVSRPARHASYGKGFRIRATSIRSYLDLDSDTLNTNLTLNLNWEPRLRLIKLMIPRDKIEIVPAESDSNEPEAEADDSDAQESNIGEGTKDEDGDEDEVEQDQQDAATSNNGLGTLEFGISRGEYSSQFELPVAVNGEEVKAVDIKGEFKALIAGRNEVFRFEDLTKALENKQEIERSGIRVQVLGRTDDDYLTGFTLRISFADAKKSLESHFGWVYENPAYMVDPDGNRHEALTVESAGQGENETSMLFLFDKLEDPKGWKLEYHSPGILVETTVPFELKKVRLP